MGSGGSGIRPGIIKEAITDPEIPDHVMNNKANNLAFSVAKGDIEEHRLILLQKVEEKPGKI